jgi:hypothetical protein
LIDDDLDLPAKLVQARKSHAASSKRRTKR